MKLVIVESPAKSKTIGHYLGEDYIVEASVGHIRDLATSGKGGFGVNIEDDFKPTYAINKDKTKVVNSLKKKAKSADEVILATDPDREGEAIAYHLATVLDLPIESTKRLEFHEITKGTILNALDNPRTIDMNLVHSQETRRIIDRILGFMLSKLLKSKIRAESAGRVQSVALRMICDHEDEILNFIPEKYYELLSKILVNNKEYDLELYKINGKKVERISDANTANLALKSLENDNKVKVNNIESKEKNLSSKEPFRTSTLQQAAFSYLGFSTKETTYLAQELYEGCETDEGLVGLITYIRTDSTRIAPQFVNEAKPYIESNFGKEYFKGVHKSKMVEGQQDAHECIRPTSVLRTPEKMKKYLSLKAYKLYKLIYERALSSLMSDKKVLNTTVSFIPLNESKDISLEFKLSGSKTLFPGYDIFKMDEKDKELPEFKLNDLYDLKEVKVEENETKAPARYSEGKMVKLMEDEGIGRPSTYSSTIQTLKDRKYITSTKGVIAPTEKGMLASKVLVKYFPEIINVSYTANMEKNLDLIQNGSETELHILKEFYYPFLEMYEDVKEKMYKEPLKKTGEKCPECGKDLVERFGRYGKFVCCEDYPNCKYVKKEEKEAPKLLDRMCPECGSPLVVRKNKRGEEFIGCSNFPKCRYIEGSATKKEEIEVPDDKVCPNCGAKLVVKYSRGRPFLACPNYPKCKHAEKIEK